MPSRLKRADHFQDSRVVDLMATGATRQGQEREGSGSEWIKRAEKTLREEIVVWLEQASPRRING
jgi:hypothetical protein